MTAIVNQPESITKTTAPNVNTEDKNDLPEGLKELNQLNEITIHECLGKADMCFQRPCRYTVHAEGADVDDHFLYIQEVSECYARQCLGAVRGFSMKISNKDQQDVVRLERPLKCPCSICWWWCCCVQELTIENPPGTPIATIREDRICCASYYIEDDNDRIVFRTDFSCCLCKLCSDVKIEIVNDRQETVAEIIKNSKGRTDECCGSCNDFTIRYLKPLHIQDKVIILGASFLIDFNFFEGQQRTCC